MGIGSTEQDREKPKTEELPTGSPRWEHRAVASERAVHSDREKREALRHVGYELDMMAHASVRLTTPDLFVEDGIAWNAYLESSLLHARALIDFFIKESTRASDIHRTDFAPEWEPAPPEVVQRLNDHFQMLHKYLAHLTWERVSVDSPDWDYPDIGGDVVAVAGEWSRHLASADYPMTQIFRPFVFLAGQALESRRDQTSESPQQSAYPTD